MPKLDGLPDSLLKEARKTIKDPMTYLGTIPLNKIINKNKYLSTPIITKIVAEHAGLPIEKIFSRNRKRELVELRQIIHYFAKRCTKDSLANIGYLTGKFDHATVLHSLRTINNLLENDKHIQLMVEEINYKLNRYAENMLNAELQSTDIQSQVLPESCSDILPTEESK